MGPETPPPGFPNLDIWRLIGSFVGATLSFLYARPVGPRDFAARLLVSSVVGFIFGFMVRDYLGWPETQRYVFAAAVAASFLSWFVIGALVRILKSTNKLPKP